MHRLHEGDQYNNCLVHASHLSQVLGPHLVGVKLTRREQLAAWWGTAVMFFVVLVPTLNSTILAYFTKQVRRTGSVIGKL